MTKSVPDLDAKIHGTLNAAGSPNSHAKPTDKSTASTGKGDRFIVLNGMVDVTMRELTGAELRAWLTLFRDARGNTARTGMSDIATRAGLTRRGVVKAINGLKARGLIVVTAKGTIGGNPNTYQLMKPT